MERILISKRDLDNIPKFIRKALNIQVGDVLELTIEDRKLVITPMKTIPAEQSWFWDKEWQKGEREATGDLKKGRVKYFASMQELLKDLDTKVGPHGVLRNP